MLLRSQEIINKIVMLGSHKPYPKLKQLNPETISYFSGFNDLAKYSCLDVINHT